MRDRREKFCRTIDNLRQGINEAGVIARLVRIDGRPDRRHNIIGAAQLRQKNFDAGPGGFDRLDEKIRTVPLQGVPKAAQIARYSDDFSLLGVTSLSSNTVSLIEPSFAWQAAIAVGSQPMDMVFHDNELFVACQGDGSVHVIDIAERAWKHSFQAGTGCESLAFF